MLKIASAQYEMVAHQNFEGWKTHVEKWVSEAANQKAELLVFPEYGSIELISLMTKDVQENLKSQLIEIQKYRDEFILCYENLSRKYNVSIVAPSFPWQESVSRFVNRAYVLMPGVKNLYQEKQMMTRFEREEWDVSTGNSKLIIFDIKKIKIGISICYDIEFPDFARKLALEGVQLLLVPSCTEAMAGMNRVHIGARARALENQQYVIVAQTVGSVNYSEAIDKNTGCAAVYSTCDLGFPDDGIINKGNVNEVKWIYADLDFSKIEKVRREGQVLNFQDLSLSDFNPK
jgi:predicted amidohydrolase